MARRGGNKKRYQYCTDSSGVILYLRGLQGHSGRNLIDPILQDNVVIPSDFFQYIYHVRCAIDLHSIIDSGLIPWGQILSNRQTAFFLPVDPMDKEHKDLDTIDLNAPRPAQYMHKAWKKHQQQCGSRAVSVQVNVVSVSDYAFHKFPFDLLIQVSAAQLSLFLCISFVMMATDRACEDAMHTSLPGSPLLSSNVGSLPWSWSWPRRDVSTLQKYYGSKARCPSLKICTVRNADRSNSCSHGMDVPYGFTYLENTWGFCDKTCREGTGFQHIHCTSVQVEIFAASASNVSGSRSRTSLEQVDGSTAAGSHGPGPSDDNRNTRRRLDPSSSPEDELSRSAVLLRFFYEQNLKGITKWIDSLWEESDMLACNKVVRIHCKAGSVWVRLVSETRGKCQDARNKDDGGWWDSCCNWQSLLLHQ